MADPNDKVDRQSRRGHQKVVSLALVAIALGSFSCKESGERATSKGKTNPTTAISKTPLDASTSETTGKPIPKAIVLPPVAPLPQLPASLPPPPGHSKLRAPLVDLGQALFSAPGLGVTADDEQGKLACASCHDPAHGFTSPLALNQTAAGKTNLRNTLSLVNAAFVRSFYWDGRGSTLEQTITFHAMGQLSVDLEDAASRLWQDPSWRARILRSFPTSVPNPLTGTVLSKALATFVRTRYSAVSAWDRYEAGNLDAVSQNAIDGAIVFNKRAGCAVCHPPPLYTDFRFYVTQVPKGQGPPDEGRGRISKSANHNRAFRTPPLRNLSATAPYFHAGTHSSLEAAIELEAGRVDSKLSAVELANLAEFVRSLSPTGS